MVVEDPRNGQFLALATYPDYDPSDFIGGISQAKWSYYNNPGNDYPLIDRAVSTGYAPGSTWKLITATAMLRYGLRTPGTVYYDGGSYSIGGQIFNDNDNTQLGDVDLAQAITESSDTYFYSIGGQFYQQYNYGKALSGPDPLQSVASQYGLGHYTGVALPGEAPGLVPDAQIVAKMHAQYPEAYPDGNWEPGFEVQEAIGEGQDLVTPSARRRLRRLRQWRGRLRPRGRPGRGDPRAQRAGPTGGSCPFHPRLKNRVTMPSSYDRAAMLAGLEGVTSSPVGTAETAFAAFPLSKYPVAGKTGTAQVDSYCPTATGCGAGYLTWPAYKQDTSVSPASPPPTTLASPWTPSSNSPATAPMWPCPRSSRSTRPCSGSTSRFARAWARGALRPRRRRPRRRPQGGPTADGVHAVSRPATSAPATVPRRPVVSPAWRHVDVALVGATAAISALGVLMVYSTPRTPLAVAGDNPQSTMKKQAIYAVVGVAAFSSPSFSTTGAISPGLGFCTAGACSFSWPPWSWAGRRSAPPRGSRSGASRSSRPR